MLKRITILLLFIPLAMAAEAQPIVNHAVKTSVASNVTLPAAVDEMTYFDGKLHISSGGMLFASADNNGELGFPGIDTLMVAIDPQMTYMARHQATGEVYYTKPDSKGVSCLFVRYEKKPGKYAVKRVKPAGFSFSIERPVFSADGRAMIFSSDCPLGFGGLDLWYSEMQRGEWQYPQNLGHNINTEGDEKSPVVYGDFLIYSSNGRRDSVGGYDLYSARLVAEKQTGDTVMMYPIGRCRSYSLCAPFCSADDDIALTFNAEGDGGWWLRRDAEGNEKIFSFKGRLDCVRVSGAVTNAEGNAVEGAKVTVRQKGGDDIVVAADKEGAYTLFLQEDKEYELEFAAPDHFVSRQTVNIMRGDEEQLYFGMVNNVTLQSFAIGRPYRYDDLFNSSVSSELSAAGRSRMDLVARFMKENPHLKIKIVSAYSQSEDKPFCTLLNNSRLRMLTEYLASKGVAQTRVVAETVPPIGGDEDEELSAAAASSRTVSFTFMR